MWPNVTSEAFTGRSEEKVLEPPSMIMWPGRAVETTVARMVAAQSSRVQAPLSMVLKSLKTYVPGRISVKPGQFVGMEQGGGGSAADNADLDAFRAEPAEHGLQQFGELHQGGSAGLVQVLDVARVESDAFEGEMRLFEDALRQLEERGSGRYAHAAQAYVHFGKYADFDCSAASRIGQLVDGERAVESDGHARAAGQRHQAGQFGLSDDRVGYQQVRRFGGHHHFGFGDFGHGQARCAQFLLQSGDIDRLVSLGVRPQAQAVLARIVRHAMEISLETVEIYYQSGRVDFRDVHTYQDIIR